ncbi:MAG: hypothetical protein K6U14_11505 [Firmicutes bacterium]|nr:hypothetical protein [Alicyclobacillaceae bacterium]MCL6498240.1 hypothetical protein [Bacillota bacterium]
MAAIVGGIGTSHSPMLALSGDQWAEYALRDRANPELVFPPDGVVRSFHEAVEQVPAEIRERPRTVEVFRAQSSRCQRAIEALGAAVQALSPDIAVIFSDDQDEWFYDDLMPAIAIYWGATVPLIPRRPMGDTEVDRAIARGYGDRELEVPVASELARWIIDHLMERDFDIAQFSEIREQYGGRLVRRLPLPGGGETARARVTPPHRQGLPHGFAFVVYRLFGNRPIPIVPIVINTFYPPNQPSPRRVFQLGQAVAEAIAEWPQSARVVVIGSGGLSHFVVDEPLDRAVLAALAEKDAPRLQTLPKARLLSGSSEIRNWVAVGGAMQGLPLQFELVDYVPVYRSEAGTGGGWAFATWR